MKVNLKISNIVLTGRMPFKRKMREEDVRRLIKLGTMRWAVLNEDYSPTISAEVEREGETIKHRKKRAYISIWTSGAINIVGVTSRKEANGHYARVVEEIKQCCKGVLE